MRLCLVCKRQIESDRSEVIPETRLCITHGKLIQKFGGEFTVTASQQRTSKQGSLKHNYGGVTKSKVRNEAAMTQLIDECDSQRT